MASFIFPNNPTDGQTELNPETNVTYMWLDDPGKWVIKVVETTPTAALPLVGGTMLGPIVFAEDQPTGTETVANILKLVDATNSTSVVAAGSANAVKTAYDLAAAAVPNTGGSIVGGNLIIKQSGSGASDGRLYIKDWENNTNFTVFPTGNLETKGMITGSSTADLNFKIRAYGKGNKGIQFLSGTNSNALTSLCLFNEAGIEANVPVNVTGDSTITGDATVKGAIRSYTPAGVQQGFWENGNFQTSADIQLYSSSTAVHTIKVTGQNSKTLSIKLGDNITPVQAVAITPTLVQTLVQTNVRCDEGLQFMDATGAYRASIQGSTGNFSTAGSLLFPSTSGDTDIFVYGRSGKNLNLKFASSTTGSGATTQININNLDGTKINSGNVSFASTSIQRLQIYGGTSSKYLKVTIADNAQNTGPLTLFDWKTTGPINYLDQTWKNQNIVWDPSTNSNRFLYINSSSKYLVISKGSGGAVYEDEVAKFSDSYIQMLRPTLYDSRVQYFRPYPAGTGADDAGDSIIINGLVGSSSDVNGTLFKQQCNISGFNGDGIYYYGNASGDNTDELATKYWVTKGGYSLNDADGGIVSFDTSPLEVIYSDPKSTGNGDVRFKASNNAAAQDQYILVQGRSDKTVSPAQHGRLIIARDTAVQNVSNADRFVGFVAPKANDTGTTVELYSDVHFAQADQEVQDILMYGHYSGKIINFKLGTNTADSCVDTFQLSKYAAALFVELDMGQNKIVNLKQPTSANDAATKTYVDSTSSTSVSYTIDQVSGMSFASRDGELNFNNSDPTLVTWISFAAKANGGKVLHPIAGTDLVGFVINAHAYLYQVVSGDSNSLSVVHVKGTATLVTGDIAEHRTYPSNFVQLTGKGSQTVHSDNFNVLGNICVKGTTGSALAIKRPDDGQFWWYIWHPDASATGSPNKYVSRYDTGHHFQAYNADNSDVHVKAKFEYDSIELQGVVTNDVVAGKSSPNNQVVTKKYVDIKPPGTPFTWVADTTGGLQLQSGQFTINFDGTLIFSKVNANGGDIGKGSGEVEITGVKLPYTVFRLDSSGYWNAVVMGITENYFIGTGSNSYNRILRATNIIHSTVHLNVGEIAYISFPGWL